SRRRISASSSTISMSCAMGSRPLPEIGIGRVGLSVVMLRRDSLSLGAKPPHARPTTRALPQSGTATTTLHDLFDDCEAKPGAFLSGRDIRLGQPVTFFLRQSLAIILDADFNRLLAPDDGNPQDAGPYPGAGLLFDLLTAPDSINGILHQI